MYKFVYKYMGKGTIYMLLFQMESRSPGDFFLNPFTVYSPCKWKFVICPFVEKETKGSYPFANRLNGLNRLAHLSTV
jgi:hypothetical protein